MEYTQDACFRLNSDHYLRVHCSWSWNRCFRPGSFVTLDLAIHLEAIPDIKGPTVDLPVEIPTRCRSLVGFIRTCLTKRTSHIVNLKCILPTTDGYVVRSDFLKYRLPTSNSIESILTLVEPCAPVQSLPNVATSSNFFHDIAPYAVGYILLPEELAGKDKDHYAIVENLLETGLSFEWLSSEPIQKSCVVWVGGRALDAGDHVLEAAIAMGISLVVVEKPGHRLHDNYGPSGHLREGFIPMDMATDAMFVDRLVEAIRSYSRQQTVHGLHTIDEIYLTQVAKACEILGLLSAAPACYTRALDKFTTRMLEPDTHGSFRAFGVADLRCHLDRQSTQLPYPLVVRPCVGWSSQCVTKVHDQDELFAAVQKASNRHATPNSFEWYEPRTDVIIEPYIDGPEVDANFVLLDGKLLFYEISDDFPKPADVLGNQQQDNFLETVQLIPSNLPNNEQDILKESLYESILRQGFTTGVFHCEARVENSSVRYTVQDGLLDLRYHSSVPSGDSAKAFLHEINPRPPAYQSSMAILGAYGVDYYALQLASCIGDKVRFRAIAQPFRPSPRHIAAVKYLHEPVTGIMGTEDACADLLERLPVLKEHIPLYKTIKTKGDVLNGPSGAKILSFLAYFVIVSKESRKSCLELMQYVEEEFRFKLK